MSNAFIKIILLVIFFTMAFPVGLVLSFNFALSAYIGGDYILGELFFDVAAAIISGYAGVWCFTQLINLTKDLKNLSNDNL